jgi:hypothetical protein
MGRNICVIKERKKRKCGKCRRVGRKHKDCEGSLLNAKGRHCIGMTKSVVLLYDLDLDICVVE